MRAAIRAVQEALPDTAPELIGGILAGLLDLWETGQKLDKELQRLTEFRFPQDRELLRDVLIWVSAIQIDMASCWIGQVKSDLPKLLRELDRFENMPALRKSQPKPTKQRSAEKRKVAKRTSVVHNPAI
jgi:hypothetical protein